MQKRSLQTDNPTLAPIELHGIRNSRTGRSVAFSVEISHPVVDRVYTEVAASDSGNEQTVVFVDKDKFVSAWRREPYEFNKEAAHGKLDDPRLAMEYAAIEHDARHSHEQPLALAYVICRKPEEKKLERADTATCGRQYVTPPTQSCYVDFNEGVALAVWLIANGARAFPVLVDAGEAEALHHEAGLPAMPPITIDRLFEAAQNRSFQSVP